ncbi:MAG: fluoride efflux transporter CrcB [Bacteroidota bacterium]
MKALLLVFLGGGLGSSLRYAIGKLWNPEIGGFPYGTFAANVLGSLIIGILLGMAAKNVNIPQNMVLFLATGFCGGFTTFSTFAYENQAFLKDGQLGLFALYAIGTFAIGIAAVFFGIWLARLI